MSAMGTRNGFLTGGSHFGCFVWLRGRNNRRGRSLRGSHVGDHFKKKKNQCKLNGIPTRSPWMMRAENENKILDIPFRSAGYFHKINDISILVLALFYYQFTFIKIV